ncbi:FAS1 domain-containing protein [Xylariomycetidae sp. FL0641]|nr:FAS1 domain-containing protein [Xylariomycetidae sp. FL0641]
MKYTTVLPLAATAAAFVIPDDTTAKQLVLETEQQAENTIASWWESLPGLDDVQNAFSEAVDAVERQANALGDMLPEIEIETDSELANFLPESLYTSRSSSDEDGNTNGHIGRPGHHGSTNLTVYQSIKVSNFTKKFAELVDDYPDLVKALNSTSANVTAFVPIDKAFEKIPHHHKGDKDHKPPKEFIEKIIQYHILDGNYPAGRVLAHDTLPTKLKGAMLGDRPQRLRVSLGLFGVRINFYSKVVMVNLFCKNGIAHGVDHILVPPPPAAKLISLFPSKFSTLSLAAEKTGFAHHHGHGHRHHSDSDSDDDEKKHHDCGGKSTGLTLFAPTNTAFRRLGPAANAFLFNTEKGLGYLRALLKYHVVVNETLYSDAYYGRQSEEDVISVSGYGHGAKHYHVDLPTLLDDKSIAVDIDKWFGLVRMVANGHTRVAVKDGVARDGVVQVINSVLIPPHPRHGEAAVEGEIEVEDLIERLAPFVEEEKSEKKESDEWQEL